jgi:hypothetical protein
MSDPFDLNELAAELGLSELEEFDDLEISMHWDEDDALHLAIIDDNGDERIVPLDELVDEVITNGQVEGDFRNLYCVAHELDRYQEKIREAAQLMEEGTEHLAELYGMDVEDLEGAGTWSCC